jgi:putative ABC transport system ATP-binding protein
VNGDVIRSAGLCRTYESTAGPIAALRDVTFNVAPGEMVALRGPSGSGKSTLVSILACVDRPTAGTLQLAGQDVARLSQRALRSLRRRHVGIVFQNFHLLDALTVRENVSLPLVLLKRDRAEIAERVDHVLELVGVEALAGRYPAKLSGGQAQRVAIARAVVHEPALILADEPTGNLDSRTGGEIVNLLRGIAHAGQTIVIATHAEEVAAACTRTLWLRDGVAST